MFHHVLNLLFLALMCITPIVAHDFPDGRDFPEEKMGQAASLRMAKWRTLDFMPPGQRFKLGPGAIGEGSGGGGLKPAMLPDGPQPKGNGWPANPWQTGNTNAWTTPRFWRAHDTIAVVGVGPTAIPTPTAVWKTGFVTKVRVTDVTEVVDAEATGTA
ncbi:hypothetical protein QBC47DRAFT_42653 [Echria macrotheca]|uniref:Uncharacterized protein n=1 Tax=Echria macrotheca TaxID=438768 RepID=A0AAJ0F9R8_9PEZI|nr:hypothetical protein QBC47DRAFT_42653 [Echria macrotheca]